MRGLGKRVGVTLKPATSAGALAPVIDLVDLVLVMSVEPGFGGQPFMPAALEKIAAIRVMLGSRDVPIEVDGGVTTANIRSATEAGASVIVAGSAVFKGGASVYAGNIAALRAAAR